MKKIFTILILAVIGCQFADAKSINDNTDKIIVKKKWFEN